MYKFIGKWITNEEFYSLEPRNVFYRYLDSVKLDCTEHLNKHILFRKKFILTEETKDAKVYISADDYYKLYINGSFVAQGPAPSYHHRYNYNVIDVSDFLIKGENTISVHTLYQGLINRVWQSGDNRHGMILDLVVDGEVVLNSDETFKTAEHTGFKEIGRVGYDTQFMEEYDSNSKEAGFEKVDFDDSSWDYAKERKYNDYILKPQETPMLVFEKISPVKIDKKTNSITVDFGSNYVGYLCLKVCGKKGDVVTIRCAQELNDDGTIRYNLRANCLYEETWILSDGECVLDQFDYKAFRYAEIILPENCELKEIYMNVRHYPFSLKAEMKEKYKNNENLRRIWDLCVNTQKYGVQEVIQDCMEREKGFYVGDGCYTALTHMILTKDDSMVRKLIDDGFASSFIADSLVTCVDCSFIQEIAEYPLILISLVLWHYRYTKDSEYLKTNYPKVISVLEDYRKCYEENGLLQNIDKWCVVEWPMNFRDGYDVDLTQKQVCKVAHISINAYYIQAIKTANSIAKELNLEIYRDEKPLYKAFVDAFYDGEKALFKDAVNTEHISIIGNVFPFGFGLCPDEKCEKNILSMITERKISSLSLFCTIIALVGFLHCGKEDEIESFMLDEGAWLRMLSEDATTTFEGWGKETKHNTSLFHLTMSYGALFLADVDLKQIFEL